MKKQHPCCFFIYSFKRLAFKTAIRNIPVAPLTWSSKEKTMSCYSIKSHNPCDHLTIENETENGFVVKITREFDGYNQVTIDFIDKDLFESCLRTGYLTKVEDVQSLTVVA